MTQHQSNEDSLTPVAWRYRWPKPHGSGDWHFMEAKPDHLTNVAVAEVEPLYALPDASQAPRSGYSQTTEVREITDTKPAIVPLTWTEMPNYGEHRWDQLIEAVAEAQVGDRHHDIGIDLERFVGHQMVTGVNFNSLNRIVSAFVRAAAVHYQGR